LLCLSGLSQLEGTRGVQSAAVPWDVSRPHAWDCHVTGGCRGRAHHRNDPSHGRSPRARGEGREQKGGSVGEILCVRSLVSPCSVLCLAVQQVGYMRVLPMGHPTLSPRGDCRPRRRCLCIWLCCRRCCISPEAVSQIASPQILVSGAPDDTEDAVGCSLMTERDPHFGQQAAPPRPRFFSNSKPFHTPESTGTLTEP